MPVAHLRNGGLEKDPFTHTRCGIVVERSLITNRVVPPTCKKCIKSWEKENKEYDKMCHRLQKHLYKEAHAR